jgi:hypothetical protein
MVATCIRFACCVSRTGQSLRPTLSLFVHFFRTVLAVKDSLRRTYGRDLDGSGPF